MTTDVMPSVALPQRSLLGGRPRALVGFPTPSFELVRPVFVHLSLSPPPFSPFSPFPSFPHPLLSPLFLPFSSLRPWSLISRSKLCTIPCPCPALFCLVLSCLALSCLALPCLVLLGNLRTWSSNIRSSLALPPLPFHSRCRSSESILRLYLPTQSHPITVHGSWPLPAGTELCHAPPHIVVANRIESNNPKRIRRKQI